MFKLKDIEKFMRDHGSAINLDNIAGELEDKLKSIIADLKNIIGESIPEGGENKFEMMKIVNILL